MANQVKAGRSSGGARNGKVIIDRFEGRYLLPADHQAPERARAILDDVVIPALESALSVLGPQLVSGRESEVWLIRRLEIGVDVNTAWGRDELARQWGWQIARRLFEAIRDGGDGQEVVRFPNRAAYLARFVADLAANNAWGQWYYRQFEGLRLLPPSSAIRTALTDDPTTGLNSLLTLSLSNLAAVLRVMSVADARRALEQLSTGDEADEVHCLEAVWEVMREHGLPGPGLQESHQALQLFVMACKEEAKLAGPSLRRTVLALSHLRIRVAHAPDTVDDLVAALEGGDLGRLYMVAGAGSAEILAPMLAAPRGFVSAVVSTARAQTGGDKSQQAHTPSEPELYTTPFGGAFLLAPLLDHLPLDTLIGDWPGARDTSFTALLRFLLLVVCLGADRTKRGFQDPALRKIMVIDPSLAHWDLTGWLAEVGPARMGRLFERLIDWRLEDGAVEGRELFLCSVPARRGRVALLMDAARGIWLSATGYSRSPAGLTRLVGQLQHGPLAKLPSEAAIYAETEFVLPLQKAQLPFRVLNLPPAGEVEGNAAEILARLDRLQSDLAYLLLPAEWKVPRIIAWKIAVLAMGLLRDFAWRLPGFARSGLPYLYRNFLDLSATFEEGPEQYTVRVGRPPLHLVLNMTGMSRGMEHLSWLDRPLVMTQEG